MPCGGHPAGDDLVASFTDENGLVYVDGCECREPIERPILFQDRLVQAILEDRKTQTRRVGPNAHHWLKLRKGDRLWVREAWAPMCRLADPYCWCEDDQKPETHYIEYRADTGNSRPGDWPREGGEGAPTWKPSIHMPRKASRILLGLTEDPHVERLQEISEFGARAEGIKRRELIYTPGEEPEYRYEGADLREYFTARAAFDTLWDRINKNRGYGWETNPEVVVLKFRRLQP